MCKSWNRFSDGCCMLSTEWSSTVSSGRFRSTSRKVPTLMRLAATSLAFRLGMSRLVVVFFDLDFFFLDLPPLLDFLFDRLLELPDDGAKPKDFKTASFSAILSALLCASDCWLLVAGIVVRSGCGWRGREGGAWSGGCLCCSVESWCEQQCNEMK